MKRLITAALSATLLLASAGAEENRGDGMIPFLAITALTEAGYWQMVRAYGDGKFTKDGGDYRETWILNYNPTPDQVAKFDADVRDYQAAKAGDGKLQ